MIYIRGECYNFKCDEDDCGDFEKASCLKFRNKEAYKTYMDINEGEVCPNCSCRVIKAKRDGNVVKLCTNCKSIFELNNGEIVKREDIR